MARLVSLLVMLALLLTSGAAVATQTCQHVDAHAHAAARQSADAFVAAAAIAEESAAAVAGEKAVVADAAAVQLAAFLMPLEPLLPGPRKSGPLPMRAADAAKLASIAVGPLLDPPLA
jgi:hypothetical protein